MTDVNCSKCGLRMHFAKANWYHVREDGSKFPWPDKCGAGAGAVAAIPQTVNADPEKPTLEELRHEIEEQYQELCEKSQRGGSATLDELADVVGNMVKIIDAVRNVLTGATDARG